MGVSADCPGEPCLAARPSLRPLSVLPLRQQRIPIPFESMTSYAPVDGRSPRGTASPLQSPSYPASASGSSHGDNGSNPFLHSGAAQPDGSQRHFNTSSGASSVGGREFGPYSALNNRRVNGSSSYDDDHRSFNSSAERLIGPDAGLAGGAAMGGQGPATMPDIRGPEPDDFLVSDGECSCEIARTSALLTPACLPLLFAHSTIQREPTATRAPFPFVGRSTF